MSAKNPTKAQPSTMIPGINRLKPNHDREMLKLKHIKSPDVSNLLRHYDPKTKVMTFFATQKRMNLFMHRMANPMEQLVNVKKGGRSRIQ